MSRSFESADCAFERPRGSTINCGYLIVPENRQNPERTIRIHVVVVPSISPEPQPDPMVYLNGGPGGYTLDNLGAWLGTFRRQYSERDLIFFDHRGIGYSEPSLACPEYFEAWGANLQNELSREEEIGLLRETMGQCRARLVADGVDLNAYNSAAIAADLDDLRRALGYETWNLYGISYGTRNILTAIREYGESGTIRSVVLDSPVPLQSDLVGDFDNVATIQANQKPSQNAYNQISTI